MRKAPATRSSTAQAERDAQIVTLRLSATLKPLDRTSAPVDGLVLFDAVRSPTLI